MLSITALLAASLLTPAHAEGATVETTNAFDELCEDIVIQSPRAGRVELTRCSYLDGVMNHVETPSGIVIDTFEGTYGWINYDASGNETGSREESGHQTIISEVQEDGSLEWIVNHRDTCFTMEGALGVLSIDGYLQYAGGEIKHMMVERAEEDLCDAE